MARSSQLSSGDAPSRATGQAGGALVARDRSVQRGVERPPGAARGRTARRFVSLAAGLLFAAAVGGGLGASDQAGGFDPSAWLQGAEGMFGAIESLKDGQPTKPMVVYFYTDWCGYCRQFERELLGTDPVKKYFADILAVRINPEAGAQEREIANYYGVSGYPAFFVHSGRSRTLSRLERMRLENGQPRLMTPDEFIAAVRDAGAR